MANKFQIGDFIKSNELNAQDKKYSYTNHKMTKAKVVETREIEGEVDDIKIMILEHEDGKRGTWWVDSQYFDFFEEPKKEVIKPVNTIIIGNELFDLLNVVKRENRIDWFTGVKKVLYNEKIVAVFFENGKKSVAKLQEGDEFNIFKGVAVAVLKHKQREINKQLKKF